MTGRPNYSHLVSQLQEFRIGQVRKIDRPIYVPEALAASVVQIRKLPEHLFRVIEPIRLDAIEQERIPFNRVHFIQKSGDFVWTS